MKKKPSSAKLLYQGHFEEKALFPFPEPSSEVEKETEDYLVSLKKELDNHLEKALEGKKVIYGPFFPLKNWRVAFIEECGAPVELIETSLTEEEVKNAERIAFEREQGHIIS